MWGYCALTVRYDGLDSPISETCRTKHRGDSPQHVLEEHFPTRLCGDEGQTGKKRSGIGFECFLPAQFSQLP